MITLTIQPDHLRALFAVAPKKDVRYCLNGAHFETGPFGALGVALDGHCLLVVRVSDQPMPAGTLYAPACWAPPKGQGAWTLTAQYADAGAGTFELHYPGGVLRHEGDVGSYPKWRRIVPSSVSMEAATFSSHVIARMHKAAALLGGHKGVYVAPDGPTNAGLVQFPGSPAFGVAMPVRDEPSSTPPDWFTQVLA